MIDIAPVDFESYAISNSMVEDENKCPRRMIYKHIFNRTPRRRSEPLQLGIEGHNVIAEYYRLRLQGADFMEAAMSAMDLLDEPLDLEPKAYGKLQGLILPYLKTYKNAPWRVISVEEKYSLQMPDPWYRFTMRLDLLVEIIDGKYKGKIAVVDWKFTNDFWSPWKLKMYQQLPKYIYVLNNLGIPVDMGIVAQIRYRSNAVEKFKHEPIDRDLDLEKGFIREHNKTAKEILRLRSLPVAEALKDCRRALNDENCRYCPFQNPCKAGLAGDIDQELLYLNTDYMLDDYGYNQHTTG